MPAADLLRPVLLALLLCLPAALRAENWNYLSGGPGGQRAAAICDLGDGGLTCLSLLCSDRQELGLAFQSSLPLSGPVEATISVDGGTVQALRFEPPVAPGSPAVARWDAARDAPLVEALKRGNRALLTYDEGRGERSLDFTLLGSARSIAQVQESCPAPRPRVADPVSYAMQRMEPVCRAAGVAFSAGDGLVRSHDLDGDGVQDAVIDWSKAGCNSAETFCTGPYCDFTFLYTLGPGSMVPALTVRGKSYLVLPIPNFSTDLQIAVDPALCDEPTDDCAVIYHSRPGGSVELVGYY
ncbi:hypothetical protein [Mangrovicoccus sp. HB161399]|uniref:hypothetical protein n=1 Tax=Mangrovicoccus sp. HB161399 TaxID=2720392 RepID=UPI001556EE86|nr:hypothetical protein [Mangrovicoccus sp. HB161399]